MFGTLRYDRSGKESEFIDRTLGFLGDAAVERGACDTCRAKKLRCSGQRAGCDRCRTLEMACVYSAVAGGAGGAESRRRKRAAASRQKPQQQQQNKQEQQQQQQQQQDGVQETLEAQQHQTPAAADAPISSGTLYFPSTPSDGLDQLLFADDFLPDLLLASPPSFSDAAQAAPVSAPTPESDNGPLLPSPCMSSPFLGPLASGTGCSCLPTVVALLEELDGVGRPAFDVALAAHKQFVNRALQVLRCNSCHARSEHVALLTRVCDKLVRLCVGIVVSYLQLGRSTPHPHEAYQTPSSLASSSPLPTLPFPPAAEPLFLGRYETDQAEWDCLMRVILSLQLHSLGALLAGTRRSASPQQQPRLQAAESKLRTLADELQRSTRGMARPTA